MTQSTASFIDQLELAATGKDIPLESVEELIESVEEKIEEPVVEKEELYTGSNLWFLAQAVFYEVTYCLIPLFT